MDLIYTTTADYQIISGPIKNHKMQCQCLFQNKPKDLHLDSSFTFTGREISLLVKAEHI